MEGKYFGTAPWADAKILSPPAAWGGLTGDKIPTGTLGFDDASGQPRAWPLRLAKIHWAALLPGLPPGDYILRCRTIDKKGAAQPQAGTFILFPGTSESR